MEIFDQLPEEWPEDLTSTLRRSLIDSGRTLVVLDEDPARTDAVDDVPVLVKFDRPSLLTALEAQDPVLILQTNSRALTAPQTERLHRELANDLMEAAKSANREVEIISSSDGTLRGHYPLEIDTIGQHWPEQSDITLHMPFVPNAGRFTMWGHHYIQQGDELMSAAETEYANDAEFGFKNAWLPRWVEEKTNGRIEVKDVSLIAIEMIRKEGPRGVGKMLASFEKGCVCVADGVSERDAQVVALAVAQSRRSVIARVGAPYVFARCGLEKRPQ